MHIAASARRLTVLLAALPALALTAAASGSPSGVELSGPRRAVQGSTVTVTALVRPAGTRCGITVRYRTGSRQRVGTTVASGGRATWRWEVPRRAATGLARMTISCGRAGTRTRSVMIVGSVIPANTRVVKQGFSQRAFTYGGSSVSWGVILSNDSPDQDALDVVVLANFVMPDNRLIGSATVRISALGAGKTHAAGGDLTFAGVPPIARLEIVAQVGRRAPALRRRPGIAHARVVPDPYDPQWVGSVEGEVVNDDARRTLESASLTAVVLDADGNILGGGTGWALASLPPGSRQFFKISSSFRAIPLHRAASALVSVTPSYR